MKLCSDIFYYSVLNTDGDTLNIFYECYNSRCIEVINEIFSDQELCERKLGGVRKKNISIPNIVLNKFRNALIPNNVPEKYKFIHFTLIESIRVAALLHDIGHPPFSHVIEHAMKEVYTKYSKMNDNERIKQYVSIMDNYLKEGRKLHEQMGDEISRSILREVIINLSEDDVSDDNQYNENIFELMVMFIVGHIFSDKSNFSDLHRIIDSSLDGDRLDYVTRDSINSGLNNGMIDYSRIINEMRICYDNTHFYFCEPLKAINSVEDFTKRRYNIYKDIINHHRVIKTDYLLEDSVKRLIEDYLNSDEKVQENGYDIIPFDISGLWYPLGNYTDTEKANALSQWNDSWLMTVLKQLYYQKYKNSNKNDKNRYILKCQLSELLRNKKHYYSVIKRGENFKVIDDSMQGVIKNRKSDILNLVEKIQNISKKIEQQESKKMG